MAKILITTSSFDMETPEIAALEAAGYDVVLNPLGRRLDEKEISDLLTPDTEGLIAGLEPLTAAVMKKAPHLRVISRCGAGLDNVDLTAAESLGIKVLNTPEAPARAVAELTVGLMFDVLRNISVQDRALRAGEWIRPMGGLLGARRVGIIGYGRIGRMVAKHVSHFGAAVLAYDPAFQGNSNSEAAIAMVDLDTLLTQSDIISLHMPYSESSRHIIGHAQLKKMKPGSILINTARGGLVDEHALAEALQSGHLAGAALDVFEKEPYEGPLTNITNIVLTTHVGSYAKETRNQQEAEAALNLLAGLQHTPATGSRSHG